MNEESIKIQKATAERQGRLAYIGNLAIQFMHSEDAYAKAVQGARECGWTPSWNSAVASADDRRIAAREELYREIYDLKEYDRANGGAR